MTGSSGLFAAAAETSAAPGERADVSTRPGGSGASAPRRRAIRGRRSTVTPNQRVALWALCVVAALAGAFSPGAPTGHAPVDAVYRSAFVVIVALAASRSRRWAAVIAALVPALFGDGSGRVFGIAALVICLVAAYTGTRDRVVGAAIGTLIGAGVLRLDVGATTGLSAALAAVAIAPVLWSGHRQSASTTRRTVRRSVAAFAAVLLLGCAMLTVQAISAARNLQTATDATISAINAAQDGDTISASASLATARSSFDRAASAGSSWWSAPAKLVPVGAQHASVVTTVSETGTNLSAAAADLATSVDYDALRLPGGGVDLAAVRSAAPIARNAASELRATDRRLDEIDDTWLIAPLTTRLTEYRDRVDEYASQTLLAATALETVPAMLGADGERRYLILLSNPAELRDLGGHIGNWAVIAANNGLLRLDAVGTPLELSQPQLDRAVADDPEVPPSLLVLQPARYPQNWGGALDMNVTARLASRLYQASSGTPIDGVAYADPHAFAALLDLTGPIEVPGAGVTISGDSAVEFLTRGQFVEPGVPGDALTGAIKTTFERFSASPLPSPRRLGELFAPLVQQGRLRMVSLHETDQALLSLTGLADSFAPDASGDYLSVVNRNANPSKIDAYLSKHVDYAIDWNPDNGDADATVRITLDNNAPAQGLSGLASGSAAGLPPGTNMTDVAIVTPLRVRSASLDGTSIDLTSEPEGRGWRHTAHLQIPAGTTVTLELDLQGSIGKTSAYSLLYGAQAILGDSGATFEMRANGRRLVGADKADATRVERTFQGTGLAYFETKLE